MLPAATPNVNAHRRFNAANVLHFTVDDLDVRCAFRGSFDFFKINVKAAHKTVGCINPAGARVVVTLVAVLMLGDPFNFTWEGFQVRTPF